MGLVVAFGLLAAGLALVVACAERLVAGVVGASRALGVSQRARSWPSSSATPA
jgi:Ca2+/Na+ antiporter